MIIDDISVGDREMAIKKKNREWKSNYKNKKQETLAKQIELEKDNKYCKNCKRQKCLERERHCKEKKG